MRGKGESPFLKPIIAYSSVKINMADALRFLGVFFIAIAAAKLVIVLFRMWRERNGK